MRMATTLSLLILSYFLLGGCSSNKAVDYPYRPVEFTRVHFTDQFWLPRLDTNRVVTIPYDFEKCEETHRIANFAIAGGLKEGEFKGYRYNDSDVFKIIEAASYSLHNHPNPQLEAYLDTLIRKIGTAQEKDGYLFTCRTINPGGVPEAAGKARWSNLKNSHELYNAGHMYEAAVAHYRATGKRNFLDIAIKNANLITRTFGPGKNQLHGVPGHQEIEIGLVKLYRLTGKDKYLKMARYFLDQRGNPEGHELHTFGDNKQYTQDHKPVVEQKEAVGHAVRAGYMYSGMADVAALTGDKEYLKAIDRLWRNVARKKLYITGGIGARRSGEAFGENYQLPNLTAYCETCAAVANMLWNQRLFLLHGHGKYIDLLERTLYNNFLSGVSIHGDKFFYPNPLESSGSDQRSPWFSTSCCPTNVARFMPSLPGYVYAQKDDVLFVNLYIGNRARIDLKDQKITLEQETSYPWEGKVTIHVKPQHTEYFGIKLRIPGWARNQAVPGDLYRFMDRSDRQARVWVNGEQQEYEPDKGYVTLNREWKEHDTIRLQLPMPTRKVLAHDSVKADRGKYCLQRGPLVYAAEWVDNGGKVSNLMLDKNQAFSAKERPGLVDGIHVIKGKATALHMTEASKKPVGKEKNFTAIPYYAWAHRGPGEMMVWMPYKNSATNPTPLPTPASKSKVSASHVHEAIKAVQDRIIPEHSGDHSISRLTFWDHKGTKEWIQYDLQKSTTLSSDSVYWFDDRPRGGCRLPQSWKMPYRARPTGQWQEKQPLKIKLLSKLQSCKTNRPCRKNCSSNLLDP